MGEIRESGGSSISARKVSLLVQRDDAVGFELLAVVEVTFWVEMIVNRGVGSVTSGNFAAPAHH
jgi:hypothetical protein